MATTAKVRCNNKVEHNDQVQYAFGVDYTDEAGRAINAEWAKFTPSLSLSITVKPEVEFEVGRSYTLTFAADDE